MPRSVTILGPVPPPRGGVSMHVLRLATLLRHEGHAVRVLPWSGHLDPRPWRRALATGGQWSRLAARLPAARGGVIHLHYAHLAGLLAVSPWLRRMPARWVVTLHSVRLLEDLERVRGLRHRLALQCLARCALVIAVRQEIVAAFATLGLKGPDTLVMPAFLPPAPEEWAAAHLPPALLARLDQGRTVGELQLVCAAYYLGPGYGREDLYGVEAAAGALAAVLPRTDARVRLHVMVSNPLESPAAAAARRLADLEARTDRLAIEVHVNEPLVPVTARADAFLRPSREDGDSVAVREALALGRPVWASDVVRRPDGCTLFSLADRDAMQSSLAGFLQQVARTVSTDPGETTPPDRSRYREFAARLVGAEPPRERTIG